MTRMVWRSIIVSKSFYVRTYRRVCGFVFASISLNLILIAAIIYCFIHQPMPDYYATNGVTPPIQITPLDIANSSINPLLPPDPVITNQTKLIPE